ncbi:hypothetical protein CHINAEXTREME_20760 (plasmid) [Halobiforma lacisalsi AJ5]|uniref:Uncharacterized protein n=1 Tax=Natronobacterium lacisalsi AJ5 TaxID=358396 RepID=A0A1P8LWS1_NATLA|nr:hypothetical protein CHINAEXTREME_20760 [Halobiforma lacisalsi AJ5]
MSGIQSSFGMTYNERDDALRAIFDERFGAFPSKEAGPIISNGCTGSCLCTVFDCDCEPSCNECTG